MLGLEMGLRSGATPPPGGVRFMFSLVGDEILGVFVNDFSCAPTPLL